jgi:hypothetical protein
MSHLRRFCAVFTLVCAFSFSAYAGNIPCPGVTSEPPEQTTTAEETEGDMNFPITEIIVTVIDSVLLLS